VYNPYGTGLYGCHGKRGYTEANKETSFMDRHGNDVMVCLSTPLEALEREWDEHGLDPNVHLIAGPEMGAKAEHLTLATHGKYEKDHVLMIGDALHIPLLPEMDTPLEGSHQNP
jgi:hypothetical protein